MSKAHLRSSTNDTRDQVVEPSDSNLEPSDCKTKLEDDEARQEARGSHEKDEDKGKAGAEEQEESDGETSGHLKVSDRQDLRASIANYLVAPRL